MRDKKVGALLALGVMVTTGLVVAACGGNTTERTKIPGYFNVADIDVNGKKVTCVTWADTSKGGVSCDWANAR